MDRHRLGRWIIGAFGVVYVLVGVIGFGLTGFDGFAARQGEHLFGIFEVNPLHNVVHLLVGLALLGSLALRSLVTAAISATIGAVFVLLAIFGPLMTGTDGNILALNTADHWLHAATALALLTAAYLLYRPRMAAEERLRRAA